MKTASFTRISLLASLILLAGAGCQESLTPEQKYRERYGADDTKTTDDTTTRDSGANRQGTSPVPPAAERSGTTASSGAVDGELALTASVVAPGSVELTWEIADTIARTDDTRVYLLYSTQPEPENNDQTFWWRHRHTVTSATWDNIPPGTLYFRACVAEDDECFLYSDDIALEVGA